MGLGIGLELGGHLFYVCLSAKRKRLLQGGHLKNPSLAFGHFSPLPPMYSGIFFSFFFLFRCTKLHDQHGGVVGGGAWDFKTYLEWAKKKIAEDYGLV